MKRKESNRVVTVTFIVEDGLQAENVINEVSSLATERGCNLLFTDIDKPQEHHIEAAEEAEIFDDVNSLR